MILPTLFAPAEWGLIAASEHWLISHHCDPVGLAIYGRHYSARRYRDGRVRKQFTTPGDNLVLVSPDGSALFVWYRALVPRRDGQQGVNCSVFRNEGSGRSSDLIREAMAIAWQRWPGARLFTYVDPRRIRSTNPGWCFLCAGWRHCGRSKTGKVLLEVLP
jgi:hypothetical protein